LRQNSSTDTTLALELVGGEMKNLEFHTIPECQKMNLEKFEAIQYDGILQEGTFKVICTKIKLF
jgi:hypothetical protein